MGCLKSASVHYLLLLRGFFHNFFLVFFFFFYIFVFLKVRSKSPTRWAVVKTKRAASSRAASTKLKNFCFFLQPILLCCYFLYTIYIIYIYVYGYIVVVVCLCFLLFIYLWHMPKRIHLRSKEVGVGKGDGIMQFTTCDVLRCFQRFLCIIGQCQRAKKRNRKMNRNKSRKRQRERYNFMQNNEQRKSKCVANDARYLE